MVDFAKLKSARGSNLAKLTEKLETLNKGSNNTQKDERIFKPGFDKKEGKGYAVVRFLPSKDSDPFVRVFNHAFNASGGWYIENSRSTIGEDDPVGISNTLYWKKGEAEGNESLKNIARKRKRNTKYYANVLVIKDTINPDNNGKVMIYEFGGQIFKLIEGAAKPEFEDDQPMDPFDMWSGADFKIKIVGREIPDSRTGQKTIVPNYESSEFANPSELYDGDDKQKEALFAQTHDLNEFLKFKTFDELAERFKKVTGESHTALESGDPATAVVERLQEQAAASAHREPEQASSASTGEDDNGASDDGDDVMQLFRQLAEQSQ